MNGPGRFDNEVHYPGDWHWMQEQGNTDLHAYLSFVCPCGCGAPGLLPIRGHAKSANEHDQWTWDGDVQQPTLTPSILRSRGCGWHGYMTAGVLQVQR